MPENSLTRILLSNAIVLVGAMGLFVGYDHWHGRREQTYQPPLAITAAQYKSSLPLVYHRVAERVRGSVLVDKQAVVKELQENARPLATALDQAFSSVIDDKGRIINPEAAADVLEQTSRALR